MKRTLTVAVFILMISGAAFAVTTRYFELSSLNDFLAGKAVWVEISALGKIRPGPAFKQYKSGEQLIWSILAHSSGKYFMATGIHGKVLVMEKDSLRTTFQTESVIVSSLAEGHDGKIYAATAPGGAIYEMNADGSGGKKFCTLEDDYVWALAVGKDGTIYAGTGPKGMIFAVGKDAKPKKILDVKDDQVVRLAVNSTGKLLAGTAKKGALYIIDPSANYSYVVLASFPNQELSGLAIAPDGSIVLGLNSLKIRAQQPQLLKTQEESEQKVEIQQDDSSDSSQQGGSQEAVAQAKCQIMRVTEKGIIETLFQQKGMYISDIIVQNDGKIIFTSGPDGRLFAVTPEGEVSLMNDVPQSQGSALAARNGILAAMGTANPGVLYMVDKESSKEARFTSKVLDASLPSDWGRIQWNATGEGIAVETRSGNIETPDKTWSAWQAISGNGQPILSPGSRYLQVRVSWKSATAEIRSIRVYYRTMNQTPVIFESAIGSEGGEGGSQSAGNQQGAANQPGASGGPVKIIRWGVRNLDNDKVGYMLEYRREGEDLWVPITSDYIDKTSYKWDTSDTPDGWYRIRITATDKLSNPPGQEKKSTWITEPILVDNNKPMVKNLENRGNIVTGVAEDSFSIINSLAYSLDGGDWVSIWPEGGFFDQTSEKFRITLEGLKKGKHELVVSTTDEGGNSGVGAIVFEIK